MPPKSKTPKLEWQQCVRCLCIINIRDVSKHSKECQNTTDKEQFQHGYIWNDTLHGVISPYHKADGPSLPSQLRDDIILLNVSSMMMCGLSIGKPCIVDERYVRIAWPSASVAPGTVQVPEDTLVILGRQLGDLVTVTAVQDAPQMAANVMLSPREWNDVLGDGQFEKYLKHHLCGRSFTLGNDVSMCYYGQRCRLQVAEISPWNACEEKVHVQCKESDTAESRLQNLTTDLSELDLSADSSLSFLDKSDTSVTSTPLRGSDNKSFSTESVSSPSSSSTPDVKSRSLIDANFQTPQKTTTDNALKNIQKTFYKITANTRVVISKPITDQEKVSQEKRFVTFDMIGGLSKQILSLKEMINLPLHSPEVFKSYGLPLPRGILLFGPSGTGKTMLLKAVANQLGVHVIDICSSDIISKFYGESEENMRNVFKEAEERSPTIIIMDDVDSLFPRRDTSQNESQKRLVATLLTLMDGIDRASKCFVMVIAACCMPDSLDPAIRRPGRFDREIEIGVPTATDRLEILQCVMSTVPHSLSVADLTAVADTAHGYVGADLAYVCQQASINAVKRNLRDHEELETEPTAVITREDIAVAMTTVQPSAMREVQLEIPKVLWSDVGGQEEVKLKLKQAVEWPLKHPEAFLRMGIKPPRGVLMYGPPGCSKTMIAKALATESGLNFLAVKGPELFSKWVGESERAVRELFRKARSAAPSIVFFDEIDALAVERGSSSGGSNVSDRVLAQLLTEIDGVDSLQDVTVIAATNRPDMIDKALMRPGRLDRILYVPLPDMKTRQEIFRINMAKMPVDTEVDIESLVKKTTNYSGAEVSAVCHEAAMFALQEDIDSQTVHSRHFEAALTVIKPRITVELIEYYKNYQHEKGMQKV
ncbi:ATPase family gene 2 protein homolog A-like [Ylistrum balloti]|uniref:ATPase family gene 2 protein homolog A-like n=1 Tax=Ylistrum balloti TaxID=509963 RepID=UPI002905D197|nr:ATPase family gene 2 protein homolog A-like [Ylistrum balloti]